MSQKSTIQAVVQTAKRTFARSTLERFNLSADDFRASVKDLKVLMDSLRAKDVGLERSKVLLRQSPSDTPVTYIKIHEDKDVSIGIFLVKAGSRIPLHNHPKMHGLLKVVYGNVNISTYSKLTPQQCRHIEVPQVLRDKTHLIDQGFVFPTDKVLLKSVSDESETLVLSPEENNYHEISTVGEDHAAFFDILAPPYHTETDMLHSEEEVRECHFFSEITLPNNNILTDQSLQHQKVPRIVTWLRRIRSPDDYFCDTEPYQGPAIHTE